MIDSHYGLEPGDATPFLQLGGDLNVNQPYTFGNYFVGDTFFFDSQVNGQNPQTNAGMNVTLQVEVSTAAAIPEPSPAMLVILGAVALGVSLRQGPR